MVLAIVIKNDAKTQNTILSIGKSIVIGILKEIYPARSTDPIKPFINPIIKAETPNAVDSDIKIPNTPPLFNPILRMIPISLSILNVETRMQINWAIAAKINDSTNKS